VYITATANAAFVTAVVACMQHPWHCILCVHGHLDKRTECDKLTNQRIHSYWFTIAGHS